MSEARPPKRANLLSEGAAFTSTRGRARWWLGANRRRAVARARGIGE